jgi:hypothetical protein
VWFLVQFQTQVHRRLITKQRGSRFLDLIDFESCLTRKITQGRAGSAVARVADIGAGFISPICVCISYTLCCTPSFCSTAWESHSSYMEVLRCVLHGAWHSAEEAIQSSARQNERQLSTRPSRDYQVLMNKCCTWDTS